MAEPRENRGGMSDVEKSQRTERETTTRKDQRGTDQSGGNLTNSYSSGLTHRLNDPFAMMNALHREMDRMFEDFGFGNVLPRSPFLGREIERSMWSPQVEVYEKDGKLHVRADLPGLDKKDVHVELKDNVLAIEGERRDERSDEKGTWSERSYGRFFRSIPLPEGINAESANAKFENGVLDVTIEAPRNPKSQGKRIEIQ